MNDIVSIAIIKNRLNWVDWAKAIAITLVVLGHLPMDKDNYLIRYLTVFHMPLFFFISGFLTKIDKGTPIKVRKYMTSLILPYFIYNAVFYPYWLVRYYIENGYQLGLVYDWTIKPFLGIILLQYESSISCNVNGVTWFLAALLLMRGIFEVSLRWKYGKILLYFLALLCISGYIINEQVLFTKDLTPIGFMKCMPFFLLGFELKGTSIISSTKLSKCISCTLIGFFISQLTFILSRQHPDIITGPILFYATCLGGNLFVISVSHLFDSIHSIVIENISKGTLMIMGLHWMIMGTINFMCSSFFTSNHSLYIFNTLQGLIVCIIIEAIIYPCIIWSMRHAPLLIGKKP